MDGAPRLSSNRHVSEGDVRNRHVCVMRWLILARRSIILNFPPNEIPSGALSELLAAFCLIYWDYADAVECPR